ncbi:G1/S-specific cyclin-E2-like [Scleropages formosus]|uniref:G1/S-specific cyclin-E2-like n=1 Tax=Scleropages formosus TaxID=113540 RepID=A0A0P7Z840_SCLFO|nr:G1/S-specific cyclin-E2-like [Scleropages formosus]
MNGLLQDKDVNSTMLSVKLTRKKASQGQCLSVSDGPSILSETPHKELEVARSLSEFRNLKTSPLPCLSWGSSDDVWIKMLNKDLKYIHDKSFMKQNPNLQPKMRSILLDWLLEVSEEFSFHRETFYLAQDYFDRFMMTQDCVDKNCLQLIGITALFIASKVEEIYPPKLQDFAYLTDGSCLVDEIKLMELIMLKALNWEIRPETVISWLKLYIQVASLKDDPNILVPQFSQKTYIQIAQLLDLCILDINSLDYQYGVLAAAALSHFTSFEVAQNASGLRQDILAKCVSWMTPFMKTISESACEQVKDFTQVAREDGYNIQTHVDYLTMLTDAQQRQLESMNRLSPVPRSTILTPPKSTEKPSSH